jgi:hypothetical protein
MRRGKTRTLDCAMPTPAPLSLLVQAAHQASSRHRAEIEKSTLCGCFRCLKTFPPGEIKEWIAEANGTETALCPLCGIDSVIGDASGYELTDRFLSAMQQHWFAT